MPEIIFSQEVSDLIVKHELLPIRYNDGHGLGKIFKIRGWGSIFIDEMQESINDYKDSEITKDHCIFVVPHPVNAEKNLIYFSELSEKELLKLISLKAFW